MKTNALVTVLLVTAAASADARFAWPYPRKPLSPDETGQWIVINDNLCSHETKVELPRFTDGQTRRGDASPAWGEPDSLKSICSQTQVDKALRNK